MAKTQKLIVLPTPEMTTREKQRQNIKLHQNIDTEVRTLLELSAKNPSLTRDIIAVVATLLIDVNQIVKHENAL